MTFTFHMLEVFFIYVYFRVGLAIKKVGLLGETIFYGHNKWHNVNWSAMIE